MREYVDIVRQVLRDASPAIEDLLEPLSSRTCMISLYDDTGTGVPFTVVVWADGSVVLDLPGTRFEGGLGRHKRERDETLELLAALVSGEVAYPVNPRSDVVIRSSDGREIAQLPIQPRRKVPNVPWGVTFGPYSSGPAG